MTYHDHHHPVTGAEGVNTSDVTHSWAEFTRLRLDWIYGPGRENTPDSIADRKAWRELGRRTAA